MRRCQKKDKVGDGRRKKQWNEISLRKARSGPPYNVLAESQRLQLPAQDCGGLSLSRIGAGI